MLAGKMLSPWQFLPKIKPAFGSFQILCFRVQTTFSGRVCGEKGVLICKQHLDITTARSSDHSNATSEVGQSLAH